MAFSRFKATWAFAVLLCLLSTCISVSLGQSKTKNSSIPPVVTTTASTPKSTTSTNSTTSMPKSTTSTNSTTSMPKSTTSTNSTTSMPKSTTSTNSTTSMPKSTTSTNSTTSTSKPTTQTPNSATSTLKPTTSTPKPTTTTPKPTTSTNSATSTPKSTTSTPNPATLTPKPTTTTSKQTDFSTTEPPISTTPGTTLAASTEPSTELSSTPGIKSTIKSISTPIPTPPGKFKIFINEIIFDRNGGRDGVSIEVRIEGDISAMNLNEYSIVVYNGNTTAQIGVTSIHLKHLKNNNNYMKFDIDKIRQHLRNDGSIAVAIYHHKASSNISVGSSGVMDAVVLQTKSGSPSIKVLQLLVPNGTPIIVKTSILDKGVSISRCQTDNPRNSKDFKVLPKPKATPGQKNSQCSVPFGPSPNKSTNKNVEVTIAVVLSLLVVFFVIVAIVVMYMKRKSKGLKHFQLSSLGDDDDDDLILNMEYVDDSIGSGDPTFFSKPWGRK